MRPLRAHRVTQQREHADEQACYAIRIVKIERCFCAGLRCESGLIPLMFKPYLEGDGGSGPMGVKGIASWLNEHGYPTRTVRGGAPGRCTRSCANPVYAGRQRSNVKDSRTFRLNPCERALRCSGHRQHRGFRAGASEAKVAQPKSHAGAGRQWPHAAGGPGRLRHVRGQHIRTGTSHTGAMFRYYSCSNFLKKGRTAAGAGTCAWTGWTSWSSKGWRGIFRRPAPCQRC